MLQLVWNDSFAGCATAAANSAIDLNIQSFFLLVSRRIYIYIYINTHIISYAYIDRMIRGLRELSQIWLTVQK